MEKRTVEKRTTLQILISIGLVTYFVFGYLPIASFNAARGVYHVVGFAFEEKIPFMVPFIFGYSLVYGSVFFVYAAIPNWMIFKKMAWGFFWVTTFHYIFFVLFPVKMVWRPTIAEAHNFSEWAAQFIFSLDNTYNCFPSLHVAYPTMAAVISWRFIPRWRWWFVAMTVITAFSVVLVKQHYIVDAVAGAVVSIFVGRLMHRTGQ